MFASGLKLLLLRWGKLKKGGSKREIGRDMSPIINEKSIVKIFMAIRKNLIYKPIQNRQIYKNRYVLLR